MFMGQNRSSCPTEPAASSEQQTDPLPSLRTLSHIDLLLVLITWIDQRLKFEHRRLLPVTGAREAVKNGENVSPESREGGSSGEILSGGGCPGCSGGSGGSGGQTWGRWGVKLDPNSDRDSCSATSGTFSAALPWLIDQLCLTATRCLPIGRRGEPSPAHLRSSVMFWKHTHTHTQTHTHSSVRSRKLWPWIKIDCK